MRYNDTEVGASRPMLQSKLRVPPAQVGQLEAGFSHHTPQTISSKELFWGDGGRQHFAVPRSETYQFQPGRRKLYPGASDEHKAGGIKKLAIPEPRSLPRAQQRHLPDAQQRSGYDVPEFSIEKALNRKNMVQKADGSIARDFISKEVTLDVAFGIKKKLGGVREMRNGIPVSNPGDKLYAAVEYSPGFYKEFDSSYSRVGGRGGTGGKAHEIPPAGEARAYAAARDTTQLFNTAGMTNTMGRNDTLNFRPRLNYEEKMRIKQTQDAVNEVEELTEGKVTTLNEGGLSWEDRTQLFVWKPKSKRDKEAAAKAAAEAGEEGEEGEGGGEGGGG